MEAAEIARRMYERVNGTDPTQPWCPGGWEACDSILRFLYLHCADVALELLEEAKRG
jgi:hypothetical protein